MIMHMQIEYAYSCQYILYDHNPICMLCMNTYNPAADLAQPTGRELAVGGQSIRVVDTVYFDALYVCMYDIVLVQSQT